MCDQNECQTFDLSQLCPPMEYCSGDQAQNADDYVTYDQANSYQIDCNPCPPSTACNVQMCQPVSCEPTTVCFEPCAPQNASPYQPQCPPSSQCQPIVCEQPCGPCEITCMPCFPSKNPCEPYGPQQMPCEMVPCKPKYKCPPSPCSPICSPFRRRRYIQPPRRESCKPIINYQHPCVPMTSDTVYKKSFDFIDAKTAKACRMPPVFPTGQLRSPCGDFAKETVTKLSFQPQCCVERAKPIYPNSPSLLGVGPMQALTTQKHDFVPKFQFKREKCYPQDNIRPACGCVERTTVQRLSFMAPRCYTKAESCKPIIKYKSPELPMEFETTQKLSFMPVCPQRKEEMPWARKARYCPPTIQFARDTVAKLSYQPPGCFADSQIQDFCCELPCEAPRASC